MRVKYPSEWVTNENINKTKGCSRKFASHPRIQKAFLTSYAPSGNRNTHSHPTVQITSLLNFTKKYWPLDLNLGV